MDTNIILDITLQRDRLPLVLKLLELDVEYCISSLSIKDIFYLSNIRGNKLDKHVLNKLTSMFTVLSVDTETISNAFKSCLTDLEDAIQEQCAKQHKVDCIITGDNELIYKSEVRAMNIESFLFHHT